MNLRQFSPAFLIFGCLLWEGLGQAQQALTLADVERMALENNPTLAQAAARVRAAEGLRQQAGKYPNPIVGVTGDENTSNATYRGGEIGMFGEQRIVTAGKLRLSRGVFEHQEKQAQAAEEAQRYRVLTTVRSLFFHALGVQRLMEVRKRLSEIAQEAVQISQQLANVGQADQPDLLQAEIEGQQAELEVARAEIEMQRVWRQLGAAVGNPALQPGPLGGDLEAVPDLKADSALQRILQESPEMTIAQSGVTRAEAALQREQVEKIPDILVRGGFRYSPFLGRDLKPVGMKGFFDVGIEVPLFDRNQGAIAAARAEVAAAEREVDRVRLSLRSRLAAVYQEYQASAQIVERYKTAMLPKARQAHEMYLGNFRNMAAAYPQVLIAQRNLFQLQHDYVQELIQVWRSVVEIQGMLLTGGLDDPGNLQQDGRMGAPGSSDEPTGLHELRAR